MLMYNHCRYCRHIQAVAGMDRRYHRHMQAVAGMVVDDEFHVHDGREDSAV